MSFSEIAAVYDRFNDLSVYEYWLDFTLSSSNKEPEQVLDLACGTGWFTQLLSPFVGQIIGVDIDNGMLEMAQEELKGIDNVKLQQGDMLALDFQEEQFDLITCYLDSLCFLANGNDVQQALKEMYRVLKPGGILLFDVLTPHMVTVGFDEFSYHDCDETAALLWHSETDSKSTSVTHYLTVFEQEALTGQYKRKEATLIEHSYPLNDYCTWLRQAGFKKQIEIFVDYGLKPYNEKRDADAERWFFRIEK